MMAVAVSRALPQTAQKVIWYPIGAAMISLLCYATGRSVFARLEDQGESGGCLVFARKTSPIWLYLGAVAIAFAVAGAALSFANYQLFKSPDLQIGLSLFGFLLGALAVLFGSIQLRVTPNKIEYWSLERGYQALDLGDIAVARYRTSRGSNAPYMRLEVLPRSAKNKPIYLPVMAFRRTEMDQVYNWLGPKLENRPK